MLLRNVTTAQAVRALELANAQFDGNIIFNRCDDAGQTRQHRQKLTITLRVRDSHKPGARTSQGDGHRMVAACWHAYRAFMDALPPTAEVQSTMGTWRHGDLHADTNIGSLAYPCLASDACDCQLPTGHVRLVGRGY